MVQHSDQYNQKFCCGFLMNLLPQSRGRPTGRAEVVVYFLINICFGGQKFPYLNEVIHILEFGSI